MKKVFIGLIFVFLNLSIFAVNLLPSFVGYILIFLGLDEEYECSSLSASRTIAVASAILMAVVWGVGLFGYGMTFPLGAILQLLNTYRLVIWAEEQAGDQGWEREQTQRFRLSWYALAGTVIAATLLSWVGMALVWGLVALAATIYYIYVYYGLWKSAIPEESE